MASGAVPPQTPELSLLCGYFNGSERALSPFTLSCPTIRSLRHAFAVQTPLSRGCVDEDLHPGGSFQLRAASERAQKRVDGSVHSPLNHLVERRSEIPRDRPVFCAGATDSPSAASLLPARWICEVSELAGGIAAWVAAGLPLATEHPRHCEAPRPETK